MLWLYSFHQLDILGLLLDRHPVTSLDIAFINSELPFHSIAQSTDIKALQQSALKAALPRKHKQLSVPVTMLAHNHLPDV